MSVKKWGVELDDWLGMAVLIVACAFAAWLTADTGCACSLDRPTPAAVSEEG